MAREYVLYKIIAICKEIIKTEEQYVKLIGVGPILFKNQELDLDLNKPLFTNIKEGPFQDVSSTSSPSNITKQFI